MSIPSAKQISPNFGSPHESLDEGHARKQFFGKTLEQAESMFRSNALFFHEDLLYMGRGGFCFYVIALIRYLQSDHAKGDSDAINGFINLLEQRLELPAEIRPVARDLADACQHVLERYDRFDASPEIYGDLRPRYEAVRAKLRLLYQSSA